MILTRNNIVSLSWHQMAHKINVAYCRSGFFTNSKCYLWFEDTEHFFEDIVNFTQRHIALNGVDEMRHQIFISVLCSLLECTYGGISLYFITVYLEIPKPSNLSCFNFII